MYKKDVNMWTKKDRRFVNSIIRWGYLHISDGVEACSGTDTEKEEKAKKRIINRLNKTRKKIADTLRAVMFMYEHHWPGEDNLRVCETCNEQVKRGSPCTASVHYCCWKALNDISISLAGGR